MNPLPFFAFQGVWFLIAWTVVAVLFVAPRLRQWAVDDAIAICTAPQLFRVLGVGLLVPNLAPDMPRSFALATAIGDSLTAVLALMAVVALRQHWRVARPAAWVCNLVGVADLAIALPHAGSIGAAQFLTAQWYVPVLVGPLMIVSHVLALRLLLGKR